MADGPTSGGPDERLESWLRRTAPALPYPATPNLIRRRPRQRRPAPAWAWAAAILVVALGALLAVPQARAGLVEFLQIGVVRVFLTAPTPTSVTSAATTAPNGTAAATGRTPPTPTASPEPTLLPSLLDLAGRTRLAEARQAVPFPIRLPAYPADLGAPDEVFVQDLDGSAVVLIWRDDTRPDRIRLSLHYLTSPMLGLKGLSEPPESLETALVNGREALWSAGGYVIQIKGGNWDFRRLIEGHVLIWTEDGITLRLETDLPLDEAVRIAESLK